MGNGIICSIFGKTYSRLWLTFGLTSLPPCGVSVSWEQLSGQGLSFGFQKKFSDAREECWHMLIIPALGKQKQEAVSSRLT